MKFSPGMFPKPPLADDFYSKKCFQPESQEDFTMQDCLVVGLGGAIGTVCRYLIGLLDVQPQNGFPVKTLLINILGAFVIGLVTALSVKNSALDPKLVLMLKVGVCGGFTTFSTFAFETGDLMQKGHTGVALAYVLLSVTLGVLAVFSSQLLVR